MKRLINKMHPECDAPIDREVPERPRSLGSDRAAACGRYIVRNLATA
jgi:hypothetical protein